jgi:hypothetical protein
LNQYLPLEVTFLKYVQFTVAPDPIFGPPPDNPFGLPTASSVVDKLGLSEEAKRAIHNVQVTCAAP